jgi:hypothetical protein
MPRFRKKPVEVEASQWLVNGDHPEDGLPPRGKIVPGERTEGLVVRYFRRPDMPGVSACRHCSRLMHDHGWIDTLEGGHIVCPGDWIVTGVHGERYPVKPDIFEATYERTESDEVSTTAPIQTDGWAVVDNRPAQDRS